MKHTTKSLWLVQSLLTLALLTGTALQAFTSDELYEHARMYKETAKLGKLLGSEDDLAAQYLRQHNITGNDEGEVHRYVNALEKVESELRSSTVKSTLIHMIGGFAGLYGAQAAGGKIFKGFKKLNKNNANSATILTLLVLTYLGNRAKRATLNTKIATLTRKAVQAHVADDTTAYASTMRTLKWLDGLRQFINGVLGGAVGISAVGGALHFNRWRESRNQSYNPHPTQPGGGAPPVYGYPQQPPY